MLRILRIALPYCAVLITATALSAAAWAQDADQLASFIRLHYVKHEHLVPMRDGEKLFTSIYVPRDATRTYPFLVKRTPYSVAPYGPDKFAATLGPSVH
jgi:hypothetical protein